MNTKHFNVIISGDLQWYTFLKANPVFIIWKNWSFPPYKTCELHLTTYKVIAHLSTTCCLRKSLLDLKGEFSISGFGLQVPRGKQSSFWKQGMNIMYTRALTTFTRENYCRKGIQVNSPQQLSIAIRLD